MSTREQQLNAAGEEGRSEEVGGREVREMMRGEGEAGG